MSFVENRSPQAKSALRIYRLQRLFFAACMVLGTSAILVAASTNPPYYGTQQGIASAVATNATDSDLMDQTHLVAQLIAAYLLPLGFLTMAWLANRRALVLTSSGVILSLLGSLSFALSVGSDAPFYDFSR